MTDGRCQTCGRGPVTVTEPEETATMVADLSAALADLTATNHKLIAERRRQRGVG